MEMEITSKKHGNPTSNWQNFNRPR